MIELRYVGRLICPFIHCDHCGHEITDYRKAIVTWSDALRPRYLHKNICDRRMHPYWCPLEEHLLALAHNAGLQVKPIAAARVTAA